VCSVSVFYFYEAIKREEEEMLGFICFFKIHPKKKKKKSKITLFQYFRKIITQHGYFNIQLVTNSSISDWLHNTYFIL
jgi:hypothetical protein